MGCPGADRHDFNIGFVRLPAWEEAANIDFQIVLVWFLRGQGTEYTDFLIVVISIILIISISNSFNHQGAHAFLFLKLVKKNFYTAIYFVYLDFEFCTCVCFFMQKMANKVKQYIF